MHGHDEPRAELAHEGRGRDAADRRPVADGHEEDVDLADRRALLGSERGLPEIAEVADAEAVERELEDRVRATGRARDVVVLARDRDDLADRRLERARRRADHERLALDRVDAAVVDVLVRHEEDVGPDAHDRRVVEPQPARREHAHVGERVDDDRPLAAEQERRLAEPADLHATPPDPRRDPRDALAASGDT